VLVPRLSSGPGPGPGPPSGRRRWWHSWGVDTLIFRERLWPRATNLLLGALAGVVVGALVWPFHAVAGYLTGGLAALSIVAALLATAPRVAVDLGEPGEEPRLEAG